MKTTYAASKIKWAYLDYDPKTTISYEHALDQLEKLGYSAGDADDFLFAKDDDWRVAMIKNGEIKEGPAALAAMLTITIEDVERAK